MLVDRTIGIAALPMGEESTQEQGDRYGKRQPDQNHRDEDHGISMPGLPAILSNRHQWQAEYVRRLRITDVVVVCIAVAAAHLIRFGGWTPEQQARWPYNSEAGYAVVSVALALVWSGLLAVGDVWSPRLIGHGAAEYRRLASLTVRFFGMIATASLLLRIEFARGYLAIALPLGLAGLMVNRRVWRHYATRQRRAGRYGTRILVVGGPDAAQAMQSAFERDCSAGYRLVGLYLTETDQCHDVADRLYVPVFSSPDSVLDAVRATDADTVAVAAVERLGHGGMRDLIWQLVPLGVDLMVTPGLVDVADQRLQMRPVGNLPMLHIDRPQYPRATAFGKAAFDMLFALAALIAVAPVMMAAALAIKLTSRGPVFYRSERIGLEGQPFQMIKFRSMHLDADRNLPDLLEQNEGAGLLFKMRDDPRVTRVGRILRRYSLDELPQFFNVLAGDMSVVGPRPPLRREVERYDGVLRRRLLVKPGVTGLWQVSGRSDLPWEEAVRLDLYYIENWSMTQDLSIITKTLSAVTRSDGAY